MHGWFRWNSYSIRDVFANQVKCFYSNILWCDQSRLSVPFRCIRLLFVMTQLWSWLRLHCWFFFYFRPRANIKWNAKANVVLNFAGRNSSPLSTNVNACNCDVVACARRRVHVCVTQSEAWSCGAGEIPVGSESESEQETGQWGVQARRLKSPVGAPSR